MALILDKTTTGATSVDISGNTLSTGYTHLNYEDIFGNIHDNPYLVVDNVIIDKQKSFVKIHAYIYKDEDSRLENLQPVEIHKYTIDSQTEFYNLYFGLNIMENMNIFKSAYRFLSLEEYNGWKSDE